MIFEKEVPNKPLNSDTGSLHINNVTKRKRGSIEIMQPTCEENFDESNFHEDELGPNTNREYRREFEDRK